VTDKLRMDYINNLPGPLIIRLIGDKKPMWPLEYICVETGLLKFDVCGKLQNGHIADVGDFTDQSGAVHDPETFYSDYEEVQP
jgi:hypothetical protein